VSGDTATGRVMVQRKQRLSSNCPICGSIDEHTTHVLTCRDIKVIDLRSSLIEELNVWLCTVNTHPDLHIYIISSIEQWLKYPDSDCYNFLDNDDTISHAFLCQNKLGIYALLLGFISKHIIMVQQAYYSSLSSKKSGIRWGSNLIPRMWNIIYQHWCHRNDILHETEATNNLSGLDMLKLSIEREHREGASELPNVYLSYFTIPLPLLILKPTQYLKRWFLVIRSGREACNIPEIIDEFSTDDSLRNWIGLKPIN